MNLASLALAVALSASHSALPPASDPASANARGMLTEFVALQTPQPAHFDPARFDSVTAIALRSLLDSASAHGLPAGPLINVALQGSARKVSGGRILSSVRAHLSAMLDARTALGNDANDSELDTGADAIRAGIDGKALVAIRATRPAGTAVTALVVATDLVKRGIPPAKARDAVTALARASKSDDALNGLQLSVARNSERGPGMALDALDRYVRSNAPGSAKPAPKPGTRPPSRPDAP